MMVLVTLGTCPPCGWGIGGVVEGKPLNALLDDSINIFFVLTNCLALPSDSHCLPGGPSDWPGGVAGSCGEGDSTLKSPHSTDISLV